MSSSGDKQDISEEDQLGNTSPLSMKRTEESPSSTISSPLDGLKEKDKERAKELWKPKYDQWEEEKKAREENETTDHPQNDQSKSQGASTPLHKISALDLNAGKGKENEKEHHPISGFYDHSQGEVDPNDAFHSCGEPDARFRKTEGGFLPLTPSPKRKTKTVTVANQARESSRGKTNPLDSASLTTADEIISLYIDANDLKKETILSSIRLKLARALLIRQTLDGTDHSNCKELTQFLKEACSASFVADREQQLNDATYAAEKAKTSLGRWQWSPESLFLISEAVGMWELVDMGQAQGLAALRWKMVVGDRERDEKNDGQGGKGRGCCGSQ